MAYALKLRISNTMLGKKRTRTMFFFSFAGNRVLSKMEGFSGEIKFVRESNDKDL